MYFSFYSFRNEYHLKSPPYCGTYLAKIQEAGVIEIINPNRQVMQPYSILVNEASTSLLETLNNHQDPFSHQEDDEVEEEFHNMASDVLEEYD